AEHLVARLHALESQLREAYTCEFLFVDDGSTDDTADRLRRLSASLPSARIISHTHNRGVAASIMTGVQASSSELVCSLDSDCSYDPMHLVDMLPLLVDGVDMVTASPYHPDGAVLNVPAWRLSISKCASAIYRRALRQSLYTYTSCFRLYRKQSITPIRLQNEGFVGIAELVWQLDQRGGTIVESPAKLDVRQYGQSKMRVAQVTWGHLGLLSRVFADRLVRRRPLGDSL
ncbi:MAG: glycosyltransferase family 2 protein, partial [Planctomycetales bacterium]|nr:glycosyltransferase family 2 protein [Planctomycetales bacterium]